MRDGAAWGFRWLALATLCAAFAVVVFGAFVRLSDAGLGCPDWPGCYGQPTPAHAAADIAAAHAADPSGPVTPAKAWREMIHRYLAGLLAVLVAALAVIGWRSRRVLDGAWLPLPLALLVLCQAALGMWTVTLRLHPLVVSAHLLGGMLVLMLSGWLVLTRMRRQPVADTPWLRLAARAGLVLLVAQMVLGAWVSANHAGLACTGFPACNGRLVPELDFLRVFAGGEAQALATVHWLHRAGALCVTVVLLLLGIGLAAHSALARLGWLLMAALTLQVTLGVANVLLALPLAVALAHNAGAALLALVMVTVNWRLGTADMSRFDARPFHAPAAVAGGRRQPPGRGQAHAVRF
ncbi:MAG: heme A synthase [Zoogloea sp.]|nr:heme A synthase [Zoogloea sp.]